MTNETLYEDVNVGTELPSLIKHPTTRQLVMWAGASGDFMEIHYDKDLAIANNLPGVIVHGALKSAFLGQMITDWIGEIGTLKELECKYKGLDFPGADLICKGKVARKYIEGQENLVECELWTENIKGEKTTIATATIALPSRIKRSQT